MHKHVFEEQQRHNDYYSKQLNRNKIYRGRTHRPIFYIQHRGKRNGIFMARCEWICARLRLFNDILREIQEIIRAFFNFPFPLSLYCMQYIQIFLWSFDCMCYVHKLYEYQLTAARLALLFLNVWIHGQIWMDDIFAKFAGIFRDRPQQFSINLVVMIVEI